MKEIKERIQYDDQNAFNLLNRLFRVFPFSIQINERQFNAIRIQTRTANSMAHYLWFGHIFDELDKKGFAFGLTLYRHYDIETYNNLMKIIVNRIVDSLNTINRKPKKGVYFLNYDFMFLRHIFKCLHDFLTKIRKWYREYLGKSGLRSIANLYVFITYFPEDFVKENLSTIEVFSESINKILNYFGFDFISLSADGILRYFGTTAEAEEKKKSFQLLKEKNYKNVIEYLDTLYDHISKRDYNNALGECRNILESFFKTLLLNHKIKEIEKRGRFIKTEESDVSILAEAIRKNINNLFNFPKYSNNLDLAIKALIESSKFFVSGMANPAGSHGQPKKPKVKFKDAKAAESFLVLLFNSLIPFEK